MIVKKVKTTEEHKKVWDYLNSKGTPPATPELYYIEENGEIKSAGGLTVIPAIEPLQSENVFASYKLFNYILGVAESRARIIGTDYVMALTNNEKAQEILKKYGFVLWTNLIKQYIKEI